MRRVAVTGVGVICGLGKNTEEFWHNLSRGHSGIRNIQSLDTSKLRFHTGAEVSDYVPTNFFDATQLPQLDRFAQFALIAAREAVSNAGLAITPELSARTGVVVGSAVGGQSSQDEEFQELYLHARNRVHPLTIPKVMMNAGASHICMEFGITGPAMTVSTACSSSNHAIGQAFCLVRSGQLDVAIAGGSEAPFSFGLLKAWEAMRVVSPDACRPFSKGRSGLVLGEGGAMLVLEPLDRALARGASVFAELAGFGASSDAHHITQPNSSGPTQAMRAAIDDAAITPSAVNYINAHGTGTLSNDATESSSIREVFGANSGGILVSSTKSMHGHTLGAAGAIEAVATIFALRHGIVPPTINFLERDPECDLNVVANEPQTASMEYALSNSFAFGGLNAVLLFRQ